MYTNWTPKALRSELKYLRSKKRFIKRGHYLPMTNHNWTLAANASYRGVIGVNADGSKMKLGCRHWQPIPETNPLPADWTKTHRFCGTCADERYREIMLAEIEESENAAQAILKPLKPWWLRILTAIVFCVLAAGLSLQAWASWHDATHVSGAFDPRSDDNAEGQCP